MSGRFNGFVYVARFYSYWYCFVECGTIGNDRETKSCCILICQNEKLVIIMSIKECVNIMGYLVRKYNLF